MPEVEIERTTQLLLTEGTGGLCVTTQVVYRPQSGVGAQHGRFVKTTGNRSSTLRVAVSSSSRFFTFLLLPYVRSDTTLGKDRSGWWELRDR